MCWCREHFAVGEECGKTLENWNETMSQRKWSKASMKTLQVGFGLSLHDYREILGVLAGWADVWIFGLMPEKYTRFRCWVEASSDASLCKEEAKEEAAPLKSCHLSPNSVCIKVVEAGQVAFAKLLAARVLNLQESCAKVEPQRSRPPTRYTATKLHKLQRDIARPLADCTWFCGILPVLASWKRLTRGWEEKSLRSMVGPCIARPRLQSLGFGDPIVTVGFAEVHSVSQLVGGSGSLQCCRAGMELLPKSLCTPFFFEPA